MKKSLALFVLLVMLSTPLSLFAQGGSDICSPEDVQSRFDNIIAEYGNGFIESSNTSDALTHLETIEKQLSSIRDLCANVAGDGQVEIGTGSGTIQDPYTFGSVGDTGEGFSLRVTGYVRPADTIIRSENMFNDRPGDGEVYVIVMLELMCDENNTSRCESNYMDFELTGDTGTIYSNPFVVYEDEFDVSVFAGGQGQGALPFLIRSDDTNLRLLFRPNMFSDRMVVFEAQPSLSSGIEVSAATNINVRSGPGTNYPVVGNLEASSTEIAFGRNQDGTWVQIPSGWAYAELLTLTGTVESLPVTAQ